MSLHTSFKVGRSMKRHRSVLSRLERIKILSQGKAFDPATHSVLGLPKVKHLKIKVKKTKAAGPGEGETAAGAAAGATAEKGTAAKAGGGTAAKPSGAVASAGGQAGKKAAPSGK